MISTKSAPFLDQTRNRRNWTSVRTMRETFTVNLLHGLHARPCALLVKTLRPFRCQVEVQANGQLANGHSIMGLMALAAGDKTEITFVVTGSEAPEVLAAIRHLFETRFEDAYHQPLIQSQSR